MQTPPPKIRWVKVVFMEVLTLDDAACSIQTHILHQQCMMITLKSTPTFFWDSCYPQTLNIAQLKGDCSLGCSFLSLC